MLFRGKEKEVCRGAGGQNNTKKVGAKWEEEGERKKAG